MSGIFKRLLVLVACFSLLMAPWPVVNSICRKSLAGIGNIALAIVGFHDVGRFQVDNEPSESWDVHLLVSDPRMKDPVVVRLSSLAVLRVPMSLLLAVLCAFGSQRSERVMDMFVGSGVFLALAAGHLILVFLATASSDTVSIVPLGATLQMLVVWGDEVLGLPMPWQFVAPLMLAGVLILRRRMRSQVYCES